MSNFFRVFLVENGRVLDEKKKKKFNWEFIELLLRGEFLGLNTFIVG